METFRPIADSIISQKIEGPYGEEIRWTGPPLSAGPLPALFYFFTSAQETLERDPFNQPVQALHDSPLRCFSMTVPLHGHDLDNGSAMERWSEAILSGADPLGSFIEDSLLSIDFLIKQGWIDAERIAVLGLSRGAFIATHIAAAEPRVKAVLGFAPLTDLSHLNEFERLSEHPLLAEQSLDTCIPKIIGRKLRFYIGNRDMRVGTDSCFHFIKRLTDASFACNLRSPTVELHISPSVGNKGHGTAPNTFADGVWWLRNALKVESEKLPWI